jgi:hypothetical protein
MMEEKLFLTFKKIVRTVETSSDDYLFELKDNGWQKRLFFSVIGHVLFLVMSMLNIYK